MVHLDNSHAADFGGESALYLDCAIARDLNIGGQSTAADPENGQRSRVKLPALKVGVKINAWNILYSPLRCRRSWQKNGEKTTSKRYAATVQGHALWAGFCEIILVTLFQFWMFKIKLYPGVLGAKTTIWL